MKAKVDRRRGPMHGFTFLIIEGIPFFLFFWGYILCPMPLFLDFLFGPIICLQWA